MTSGLQDGQTSTRGPTDAVRAALGRVLLSVARAWAGVPSGPLGWVSTRTVFPLTSGTLYRTMGEALDLQPDDEVLDVGCGSGAFLAQHAGQVRRVAGIDLSGSTWPVAIWRTGSRRGPRTSSAGTRVCCRGRTRRSRS